MIARPYCQVSCVVIVVLLRSAQRSNPIGEKRNIVRGRESKVLPPDVDDFPYQVKKKKCRVLLDSALYMGHFNHRLFFLWI